MFAAQAPTGADLPSMESDPPSSMAADPLAEEAKDVAADQDVRKLMYEMRDDVVSYTERGWNWEVGQAKRKVREMRKEAEHQARLEAAPKRDRPDRRPAAAAASRRLMQQAEEEEEVSS